MLRSCHLFPPVLIMVLWLSPLACGEDADQGAADQNLDAADVPADTPAGVDPVFAAQLQEILDDWIADGGAPGVTAAVFFPEEGMWTGSSGVSNIENATPIQPDASMHIASITKTFTAALILLMAEQDLLELDGTLGTYLSDTLWPDLTIRQLLSMTDGVFDYLEDPDLTELAESDPDHVFTPAELLAVAARHDPYFQAGQGYHYSTTAYLLLALVIEQISGSPYAVELHEKLLDPLSLSHTLVVPLEGVPDNLATGYTDAEAPDIAISNINPSISGLGGGIVSTAEDLTRWTYALHHGDVLSTSSLEAMTDCTELSENFYGLGAECFESPWGPFYGHIGGYHGFVSLTAYWPSRDVAFTFIGNLCQSMSSADIESQITPLISALLVAIVQHR